MIVRRPVTIHATNNQPGEPTCRDISAETMKMPEPIIDPATIVVESRRPSPRTNPVLLSSATTAASAIMIPPMSVIESASVPASLIPEAQPLLPDTIPYQQGSGQLSDDRESLDRRMNNSGRRLGVLQSHQQQEACAQDGQQDCNQQAHIGRARRASSFPRPERTRDDYWAEDKSVQR